VREGFPTDGRYQQRFLVAQTEARNASRGFWASCQGPAVERVATVEEIPRRLDELLKEPDLTRRQFREGMIKVLRAVREAEQYNRPPLGGWMAVQHGRSRRPPDFHAKSLLGWRESSWEL
jgi:hypothetical protein